MPVTECRGNGVPDAECGESGDGGLLKNPLLRNTASQNGPSGAPRTVLRDPDTAHMPFFNRPAVPFSENPRAAWTGVANLPAECQDPE
jgi:hypothetical protein